MNEWKNRDKAAAGPGGKRSRILYQITLLIVVVMIVMGLLTFMLFRASFNKLIEKSMDRLIQTEVENTSSAYTYITDLLVPVFYEKMSGITYEEFADMIFEKKLIEAQRVLNQEMKDMTQEGLLSLEYVMEVVLPFELLSEPTVIISSDDDLIYDWKVPQYLVEAMDEGTPYIWMEDGIPELDLEREHLIVIIKAVDAQGIESSLIGVIPMYEQVAEISNFYNGEKRNAGIVLALLIAGSTILIALIIFLVLSYLIKKRITQPVDELSRAAEKVMEGDLEVEIDIREGEEFEGLKRAFKEMVESLRRVIDKAAGD